MKHLFVSYELSKLAQEKGFSERCISEYIVYKDRIKKNWLHQFFFCGLIDIVLMHHVWTDENIAPNVPAPMYQQLLDWMRIKHGVVIAIEPIKLTKEGIFGWKVLMYKDGYFIASSTHTNKLDPMEYEELLETAIKVMLTNQVKP